MPFIYTLVIYSMCAANISFYTYDIYRWVVYRIVVHCGLLYNNLDRPISHSIQPAINFLFLALLDTFEANCRTCSG